MRSNNIISFFLYFLLFLAFQILIFKNLSLYDYALCFIYVGFILLLPFDIDHMLLILVSFLLGIMIDIFYDTLGIHAGSCALVAYMRPYIINVFTPKGGYDKGAEVSIGAQGFQWMILYGGLMIFIHHFVLFLFEAWSLKLFFSLLAKTLISSFFTLIVFILFQYLFQSPKGYK
jgi:hypothetical protein